MKLLSSVAVATIFTLLTACDSASTAPSAAPVTLTDVQVSMFGSNGTFTSDGAPRTLRANDERDLGTNRARRWPLGIEDSG